MEIDPAKLRLDWIEQALSARSARKLESYELDYVRNHVESCATCLLWETRQKGSYCDSYRLYTTDCKASTYLENAPNPATDASGLTRSRLAFALKQQRQENPNRHRMLPSWLQWLKIESPDFGGYLRLQSDGDSFQIVHNDGLLGQETLLYHLHP